MKHLYSISIFFLLSVSVKAQTIYTFAGNGKKGFSGDGGQAVAAQLNLPCDVFKDTRGNVYIADRGNNRVRKVNAQGIISTIAGNGVVGYSGDGGPASSASLNAPKQVAVDGVGRIYIADEHNNVIRMIDTTGIISTIAGTGTAGFSGDGGPATLAQLDTPVGVAIDQSGNIYIADSGCSRIRKVNTSGIISTYAGGGKVGFTVDGVPATSVSLCTMRYVSVDNQGTVYFTNQNCWHFLRITTDGYLYNVAGNNSPSYSGDGGLADSANIEGPLGICPDNLGNVYLCPQGNDRVRRVNTSGYITTVAGTGVGGYSGDGGPAIKAKVNLIYGIYADATGDVYFADMGNNVIRMFNASFYNDTVCVGDTATLNPGAGSATFSSDNVAIVTVGDSSGMVTGIAPGIVNIAYNDTACPEIFVVTVKPLPTVFSGYVCKGTTLALNDTAGSGAWISGNTTVATVGIQSGIVTGIAYGTAVITHTTNNNSNSCPETYLVTDTCNEITVHDIITPNGDGINDVWVIEGLQDYPKNTVQVFDKWGNLVYEKSNYNNDWSGKGLPDGTYYYLVKLNAENGTGGGNVFTGAVLIKR